MPKLFLNISEAGIVAQQLTCVCVPHVVDTDSSELCLHEVLLEGLSDCILCPIPAFVVENLLAVLRISFFFGFSLPEV